MPQNCCGAFTSRLGTEIGSGKFGTVFHGVWNHDDQVEQVAVKMLHDVATEKDKIKLLKEAAIIEQFAHNNIVKLCGVVINQYPVSIYKSRLVH